MDTAGCIYECAYMTVIMKKEAINLRGGGGVAREELEERRGCQNDTNIVLVC